MKKYQWKTSVLCCVILVVFGSLTRSFAQPSTKKDFLYEGSVMKEYPQVEWLKGTPVKAFAKDKIYIVELWATWCVPCMAAMPHLQQLSEKFEKKGVIFIGQNVMEEDRSKVEQFVKNKGAALTYSIAYSGPRGSDFDKKWLKPAGINAIPQTFVIQNNVLVWFTHPDMLNDQVLQLLVDKKFSIQEAERLAKVKN